MLSKFTAENPSGRMGTEEEVSSAIVYLLSPAATYVNGSCIKVDGGSSLCRGNMADLDWTYTSKIPVFEALPDDMRPKLTPVLEDLSKNYPKRKNTSKL